jgi:hypothetical protein
MRIVNFYRQDAGTAGYISIDATALTVSYTNSSDVRLKTALAPFDGLDLVLRMNPVEFERVCNPGRKEYGFIAQELVTVLPQAVVVGGDDVETNPWGIDYSKLTGVLARAIQELKAQNDVLAARIAALEAK